MENSKDPVENELKYHRENGGGKSKAQVYWANIHWNNDVYSGGDDVLVNIVRIHRQILLIKLYRHISTKTSPWYILTNYYPSRIINSTFSWGRVSVGFEENKNVYGCCVGWV